MEIKGSLGFFVVVVEFFWVFFVFFFFAFLQMVCLNVLMGKGEEMEDAE